VPARQDEFERVALPHSRSLLRVARRLSSDRFTAEDIVQEALLRAWRSFDQFRAGTNARAWLFKIMINAFYEQGRKNQAASVVMALDEAGPEAQRLPASGLALPEATAVGRALDALSVEHRTVLLLGVVEGFTCREMAEILSVPIGTVMSRLSRARQSLRDQLEPVVAGPVFAKEEVR
jgi:RNA polymerase sigma-70 factor, ECF subfamily